VPRAVEKSTTPSAGATTAAEHDAAILDLFREWIRSHRYLPGAARAAALAAAAASEDELSEDELEEAQRAAFDAICEIEDRIAALPATSATGAMLKAYLLAWAYDGGTSDDPPAMSGLTSGMMNSFAGDFGQLLPEFAPLVRRAPAIGADAALIEVDLMEVQHDRPRSDPRIDAERNG
jgi:hypothetical protein